MRGQTRYTPAPSRAQIPFVSRDADRAPAPAMTRLVIEVPTRTLSATLAAVEEARAKVGARLEQPALFAREESLTHAAIGLGALSAQLRQAGGPEDPHYAR